MDQNAVSQSDCRISKSTISPEHINEISWFFACWYKLTKTKSWSKNFLVGMVKNGCCQFGHMTLKLIVSQK